MNSGQKLQWLALVAKALPKNTAALAVASALMDRLNSKSGQCNPSVGTVARDLGIDIKTARRALHNLKRAGLLKFTPTFGGSVQSSNQYTPVTTPAAGRGTTPMAGRGTTPKNGPRPLPKTVDRIRKDESRTGAPLEAAPDAPRTYFESAPRVEPTEEQKAFARKHTAELMAKLKAASVSQ